MCGSITLRFWADVPQGLLLTYACTQHTPQPCCVLGPGTRSTAPVKTSGPWWREGWLWSETDRGLDMISGELFIWPPVYLYWSEFHQSFWHLELKVSALSTRCWTHAYSPVIFLIALLIQAWLQAIPHTELSIEEIKHTVEHGGTALNPSPELRKAPPHHDQCLKTKSEKSGKWGFSRGPIVVTFIHY